MSIQPKTELATWVGRQIRKARIQAGMTQQQVAGGRYTKSYVSAIENAHVVPSLAAVEFIAARLQTSVSFLLGDETNR